MKNEKIMIGYIDTDPDTGEDYPYNPICETDSEYMANWIVLGIKLFCKKVDSH